MVAGPVKKVKTEGKEILPAGALGCYNAEQEDR